LDSFSLPMNGTALPNLLGKGTKLDTQEVRDLIGVTVANQMKFIVSADALVCVHKEHKVFDVGSFMLLTEQPYFRLYF
jgi:hypothetical protein